MASDELHKLLDDCLAATIAFETQRGQNGGDAWMQIVLRRDCRTTLDKLTEAIQREAAEIAKHH